MTAANARLTSDPATPRPANQPKRTSASPPRADPSRARRRRRILYIFSGPHRPTDGLAALATAAGFDTVELDIERGGAEHDMGAQANRARVLLDLRAGEFCAVLLATPCKTFSIARGNHPDGEMRGSFPRCVDKSRSLGAAMPVPRNRKVRANPLPLKRLTNTRTLEFR